MKTIQGTVVKPLFPQSGTIEFFAFGEAPGPRGADKSGIPFWGDLAGKRLYRALAMAGLAVVPDEAWSIWRGSELRDRGLVPRLSGIAISNVYSVCPTKNGNTFLRPTTRQLKAQDNVQRLWYELGVASDMCKDILKVIAIGKVAKDHLKWLQLDSRCPLFLQYSIEHPSSQGLLSMVRRRGKGWKITELEMEWFRRFLKLVNSSAF